MFERLSEIREKAAEVEKKLSDPAVISQQDLLADLGRQHSELAPIVRALDAYEQARQHQADASELASGASDPQEREFYSAEQASAAQQVEELEAQLRELLLPKDPNDDRNVIVEIRAAAGGDEAGLFVADLYRLYSRYAERNRFKSEVLSSSPTGVGGFKEVTLAINGKGAFSRLKYEGGTHRVQRVPETEASGRIHTSTVTVAVLPEAEEVEVAISPQDIQVDVFRSSGPGGQSVNTTDSAVRLTHIPTGLVVTCQDEKSQIQNREKAMRILRARLLKAEQDRQSAEISADRRAQVGSGERSEKIRTFNFPQNRVTDHRVGVSIHDLDSVLDGNLTPLIDALSADERTRALQAG